MSGPLQHKENTRIEDDKIIDKEVDTLFEESTKPYQYGEIMTRAESKGLYRKIDPRVLTSKVLERLTNDIEQKAKQI